MGGWHRPRGLTRPGSPVQLAADGYSLHRTLLGMIHARLLATALATLFLLTASPLHGQEPEDGEVDRWGTEVSLALNSSGGNESLTVLTTEIGFTHLDTEAYELSLDTRFRYGRSEGDEVANNLRVGLTADIRPQGRWSPFVFATAERDPLRRLDVRLNSGGGIKRTFYSDGWDEVSLSGAALYSYEDTDIGAGLNGTTRTARWSWRGRGRYQVRDGTRLEQQVFFQPAWSYIEDYLLEVQSSARVALTRTLAFTANAIYERDSTPAPEIGPDDWALAVGLSLATTW